jgi:hypothetical protein
MFRIWLLNEKQAPAAPFCNYQHFIIIVVRTFLKLRLHHYIFTMFQNQHSKCFGNKSVTTIHQSTPQKKHQMLNSTHYQ